MLSYFIREPGFYKKLIALALPMIIQNLITNSLGLVDTFMVGTMGESPLAGVTLANIPIFVVQLMMFGFQSGSSVLISQYKGKGDMNSINRVMGLGMYSAGTITLAFALLLTFIPHQFMSLFGNDPEIIEIAAGYARIVGWSYFFDSFVQIYNGTHRAMGEPRRGMYILCVSMVVNTFLNWVFIFGKLGAPAMGVAGAALGTVISRIFEFVVMVGFLLFKDKNLQYDARNLVRLPCRDLMHEYLKISIPVMVSDTLLGLGSSVTVSIIGHMNKIYMSAYSITAMVQRLSNVFMVGMSQASTLIIGHTLGEGNPEKAKKQGITMALLAACIGAVCSVIILVAGPFIISHYNITDETKEIAWGFMSAVAVFSVFLYEAGILTKGVLRGGGDTRFLMIADVLFLWVLCVPLGYLAAHVWHWPPFFLFMALRVDHIMKIVLCLPRLLSGKWMKKIKVK